MTRQATPDLLGDPIPSEDPSLATMFGQEPGQQPNALVKLSAATRMLGEARTVDEAIQNMGLAEAARHFAKKTNLGLEAENYAAEIYLDNARRLGELLEDLGRDEAHGGGPGRGKTVTNVGNGFSPYRTVLDDTGMKYQEATRYREIAELPVEVYLSHKQEVKGKRQQLTLTGLVKRAKQLKREQAKSAYPEPAPLADKQPILIVGKAEELTEIADETVNVIVTSPPYNMGGNHWDMGNRGSRESGIGYDDNLPEAEYQDWQRAVLRELYRVAAPGASLFYNHKVRIRNGQAILPTDWVRKSGWTLRQVIVWDRGSTHNHETRLFWPHDEWVLWLTKGKPDLHHPINTPSIWQFHGPVAGTWHPAPFSDELPRRCLQAVGYPGCVVLDPFAGSCTTVKVALEMGYDAIGVDVSAEYLQRAATEHGWIRI